jgi:Ca-activated chloride channel family protein
LQTALKAVDEINGVDAPQNTAPDNAAPTPTPTPTALPEGVFASAIVVLLSDGQNTTGIDPMEVVPEAKDRGVRVYTVGLGTPEGTVIRIRGRAMRVRLDEDTLRNMAEATSARYFSAATEKDLREVYQNLNQHLGLRTERTEVTALATGLATLLAVAGGMLSMFWFSRLP